METTMSRIFITGSADGLGKMAAQLLIADGHKVVLHARNKSRGAFALQVVPGAEAVITGDLSSIKETIDVAYQVNALGSFDAVIHNAALGHRQDGYGQTTDGLPPVFAVNSLAPYILTCLINKPNRLVYISSGLHRSGDASLQDLTWSTRKWNSFDAYSDSKLHNVLLAFAVARLWKDVLSNALEPGWVATKMGGKGAPDSLEEGPKTQAWLATSHEREALVSGKYFFHKKLHAFHPEATNEKIQDYFLAECERLSGVPFPGK